MRKKIIRYISTDERHYDDVYNFVNEYINECYHYQPEEVIEDLDTDELREIANYFKL